MSTNRLFVFVIAVALAVAAALVIRQGITTRASASSAGGQDDYALRHPGPSIQARSQPLDLTGSDYFQRHQAELSAIRGIDTTDFAARHPDSRLSLAGPADTTDYFQRNPQVKIGIAAPTVDQTDYAARHPELSASPARAPDLTDYYFRHPELSTP